MFEQIGFDPSAVCASYDRIEVFSPSVNER